MTQRETKPSDEREAALRHELARLRAEAAAREQRDAETIHALEEQLRAQDEFLSTAAHELRNPMSTFVLQVENLLAAARRSGPAGPPDLDARLTKFARQIHGFVKRATTLLEVSRLREGALVLELEDTDFTAVVGDVIHDHAAELERSGSTLTTDLEPGVRGLWDRLRLEQVTANLISNAIKYGAGKPIDVRLQATETGALLTVADRGIGISVADRGRIFGRFERAVTRRMCGGFGVGLWIVRQVVDAMGGEISVDSEPGVGSRFAVTIPAGRSRKRGAHHETR